VITSRANPRVRWVRELQSNPKARRREGLFVLEGVRLLQEAERARAAVRLVLHVERLRPPERRLLHGLARRGAEVEMVTEPVMRACSDLEAPPGLLGVVEIPSQAVPPAATWVLVLDRLADPGNLGSILRTAWAAGVEAVFLTEGSVDPFNPKVVRSAMGAHFGLPLESIQLPALKERLEGKALWVAQPKDGRRYDAIDWRGASALVLGTEAHGVGAELRAWATGRVHIPMADDVESLNVAAAAAVILFEIARQRGAP
jgi:TrmH family RNA methyltransferase